MNGIADHVGDCVSVVVIGRNEGARLQRCLRSVLACGTRRVVYVDSGSTDDSVKLAREMGVVVEELDGSVPFTAARARNAGFWRLWQVFGPTEYVQFVDGDCELHPQWIGRGVRELHSRAEVAVVCGRLRERFAWASIYNRLCDIEWNGPVGQVSECGGVAMYRASCLCAERGFDPSVPAGEEPELCVRLRRRGWKIIRLDVEMGWHDAAMDRFGQWWRRAVRSGYGYAMGAAMHGRSPQRHWVRQTCSIWVWGLIVPLVVVGFAWPSRGASALLLSGYGLLMWRAYRSMRQRGYGHADWWLYCVFCVLAKFPQVLGQLRYWAYRVTAPARPASRCDAAAVLGGADR